jgi:adenosylcobinamide-GDP ribazoletransferase
VLIDLVGAFMLLTRLPVGRLGGASDLGRCVWAFPAVGVVVGGVGGLVYGAAHAVGVPPLVAAGWSLAATMLMTGALHEDGLADTADGFGGGGSAARKLEIMRDSRIGSYGAAALLLSVLVRAGAIAGIGRTEGVVAAMVVAGMVGRSAMILLLLVLSPARGDGMGASVGRPGAGSVVMGLGLAVIAAFLLVSPLGATAVVVLGFGGALLLAGFAAVQIGGYTGDVLGACEVAVECVVLTVMASAFGV